jgi:hypothetical protein
MASTHFNTLVNTLNGARGIKQSGSALTQSQQLQNARDALLIMQAWCDSYGKNFPIKGIDVAQFQADFNSVCTKALTHQNFDACVEYMLLNI